MDERYTNSLINSAKNYFDGLQYLGKENNILRKDLLLYVVVNQWYNWAEWFEVSEEDKIKLQKFMDCLIRNNPGLEYLSTLSCIYYSNVNTPQTIWTWQKICDNLLVQTHDTLDVPIQVQRCSVTDEEESFEYVVMEDRWYAEYFPMIFSIDTLLINNVEYIVTETLTLNSIDDVETGIGFDEQIHVITISDWLTSVMPENSHIKFFDDLTVIEYPVGSTFSIIINKISGTPPWSEQYYYDQSGAQVPLYNGNGKGDDQYSTYYDDCTTGWV